MLQCYRIIDGSKKIRYKNDFSVVDETLRFAGPLLANA